jgi:hypothetical protein
MKSRRLVISTITATVLAIVAAVPVAASNRSCVGWYASSFAQEDARGFAAEISGAAHEARPFGWSTVAPFAHADLEECQAAN